MGNDPSIVEEFVIEAQEHLENIEDDFLLLGGQKEAPEPSLIDKIFRAAHSIKGGAGFLQFSCISELAHIMETLLSSLRSGVIPVTDEIIEGLLAGVDKLNELLADIENSNDMDISEEHGRLKTLLEGHIPGQSDQEDVAVTDQGGKQTGFEITPLTLRNIPKNHEFIYVLKYDLAEVSSEKGEGPLTLIKRLSSTGEILEARLESVDTDLKKGVPEGPLWYELLYSSIIGPETIEFAVGLPMDRITVVDRTQLTAEAERAGSTALAAPEPEAPPQEAEPAPPEQPAPTPTPAPEEFPANIMDELQLPITEEMVDQFATEADETLDGAEQALMEIFDDPDKAEESLNEAFRLIHSFKGNCGLLGFKSLERVSHTMETVLDHFKSSTVPRRENDRNSLMRGLDTLRLGVNEISNDGKLTMDSVDELVDELAGLLPTPDKPEQTGAGTDAGTETRPAGKKTPPKAKKAAPLKKLERRDIRVDLEKLDVLINLVGELVIAESMTTRHPDLQGMHLEGFERSAHNLRRIIADLQDIAMQVRMIPLSRTFRKMIRLVHDLSSKAGKKVRLELVGEDTEVDKTVIEQIADPLVHIIRNSVDHGLEPPEERLGAGKAETGIITIEARHEGGEVLIIVRDDGRGLSREKILKKAMANGLIQGDGSNIPDGEVFKMIFEAGFSTAEKITDVSGRGVGMDVVRRNLEKLKGRVDVRSNAGKGAEVMLRIPLTLAIIEGMLIRVGSAQYTLPLLSIRESFRPEPKMVTMTMDGQEVVKVRDDMIPVVRLHELYKTEPDVHDLEKGILVIVDSGNKNVCIFCDEILGQHQTVIKGLPSYLGNARGLSGCTILGNGEVSLILDVGSLIDMAEGRGAMDAVSSEG
ncbi:Signal transducing histidine kinase, homodimeric domain [Paucidesulfovibrio gracilis DSM 16080]|uniref:Chemotaxis protein CheA n=1 Tax=Paucidesulfovibrio gracilis DSM 16080 TaxID=1121449 RepID=A0A1T4XJL7_9BACT|nr:chemotaxis protein CheA [Paucidesulfovibrio gracilis]SKA89762.1 Signal transducing histidine kinase, homodimeric domain [Paucidesulfovibrio gracilis DSM 16080]